MQKNNSARTAPEHGSGKGGKGKGSEGFYQKEKILKVPLSVDLQHNVCKIDINKVSGVAEILVIPSCLEPGKDQDLNVRVLTRPIGTTEHDPTKEWVSTTTHDLGTLLAHATASGKELQNEYRRAGDAFLVESGALLERDLDGRVTQYYSPEDSAVIRSHFEEKEALRVAVRKLKLADNSDQIIDSLADRVIDLVTDDGLVSVPELSDRVNNSISEGKKLSKQFIDWKVKQDTYVIEKGKNKKNKSWDGKPPAECKFKLKPGDLLPPLIRELQASKDEYVRLNRHSIKLDALHDGRIYPTVYADNRRQRIIPDFTGKSLDEVKATLNDLFTGAVGVFGSDANSLQNATLRQKANCTQDGYPGSNFPTRIKRVAHADEGRGYVIQPMGESPEGDDDPEADPADGEDSDHEGGAEPPDGSGAALTDVNWATGEPKPAMVPVRSGVVKASKTRPEQPDTNMPNFSISNGSHVYEGETTFNEDGSSVTTLFLGSVKDSGVEKYKVVSVYRDDDDRAYRVTIHLSPNDPYGRQKRGGYRLNPQFQTQFGFASFLTSGDHASMDMIITAEGRTDGPVFDELPSCFVTTMRVIENNYTLKEISEVEKLRMTLSKFAYMDVPESKVKETMKTRNKEMEDFKTRHFLETTTTK